jgi:cell division protein FtsI (penicillin-binding protein 3)
MSTLPPQQVNPADRKRLVIVAVFLCILFSLLIFRFYFIQIVEGEKWTKMALAQHQTVLIEPFKRGAFYSNTSLTPGHAEDEQPFVIDVPKFHLFIDPDSIPLESRSRMADELFRQIGFNAESSKKMRPEFDRKSRCRKICMWLDRQQRDQIQLWWNAFATKEKIVRNALFFTSDYKRSYPFGTLLGSVLHTVQEEKDPNTFQSLPTGGLEMVLNSYLKGKLGKRLIVRSPRHPLDTGTMLEDPENGADVYLTINHYLQAIAEAELAKGVQEAKAVGGWAVMMDPKNGEILALAQIPPFNPARYADYFNDPKLQELTRVKAVSDCFEPGSIFKPITLAICFKANEELKKQGKKPLFSPEEKIATSNGMFPGRSTPLKDGRVHRFLNMDLGLQKSSNVYMARLIQRVIEKMGDRWYRNALEETFGFGQKTNIELPAENQGLLPTPGKLHPNGKLEWSLPTPYSLAIGHNILINSIQMVRAYAAIANGGTLVQPHIIRKIVRKKVDGTQEIIIDRTGALMPQGKQVLDPAVAERIVRGMKFVTKEGGTSKRADVMGYTEAGKSGTSEKVIAGTYSKQHHISSFLGFVPAKNPRFVLLVSLDDPELKYIAGVGKQQHGGVCSAPIFRQISERSLQYLGIEPDDPFGYPPGDPRRNSQKADWTAEVEALKKIYLQWND